MIISLLDCRYSSSRFKLTYLFLYYIARRFSVTLSDRMKRWLFPMGMSKIPVGMKKSRLLYLAQTSIRLLMRLPLMRPDRVRSPLMRRLNIRLTQKSRLTPDPLATNHVERQPKPLLLASRAMLL